MLAVADGELPDDRDDVYRAHEEFIRGLSAQGAGSIGGALLTEAHSNTVGAAYVVNAEDLDEARDIANRDPFAKAGFYKDVQVYPWRSMSS